MKHNITHDFARFQITQLYLRCPVQNTGGGSSIPSLGPTRPALWQLPCLAPRGPAPALAPDTQTRQESRRCFCTGRDSVHCHVPKAWRLFPDVQDAP